MQTTSMWPVVVLLSVALSSAWASTRPTTPATISLLPILPPDWPLCRLPAVCAARSPRVCGRTEMGMCRRFNNVCELLELRARDQARRSPRLWTHTQPRDCRRVRGVGASHAYWCHEECPSQPAQCPRSPPEQEICVRSRDHQICKVVANRCQLLNNNCFATPRQGWRQTDKRRCTQMQLGDKPHACVALPSPPKPTRSSVPRPTVSIVTATLEPPKDHEGSTTRRPALVINVSAG